jgi:hypothetical protein
MTLVDYILFLTLDPTLDPSPNEVSETKWVSKAELEGFFSDSCELFTSAMTPSSLLDPRPGTRTDDKRMSHSQCIHPLV